MDNYAKDIILTTGIFIVAIILMVFGFSKMEEEEENTRRETYKTWIKYNQKENMTFEEWKRLYKARLLNDNNFKNGNDEPHPSFR